MVIAPPGIAAASVFHHVGDGAHRARGRRRRVAEVASEDADGDGLATWARVEAVQVGRREFRGGGENEAKVS